MSAVVTPHGAISDALTNAENWCGGALTALGGENLHEVKWRAEQARIHLDSVTSAIGPASPKEDLIALKDTTISELRRENADTLIRLELARRNAGEFATLYERLAAQRDQFRAELDETRKHLESKSQECGRLEDAIAAQAAALEKISGRCPRVAERAEGGISDYGGNGDDMARDYADTALSDTGDIARAALTKGQP